MLQTINGIDFLLAFVILILIVWVRILNTIEDEVRNELKEVKRLSNLARAEWIALVAELRDCSNQMDTCTMYECNCI